MLTVGVAAPPLRVQPVFGLPVETGRRTLVACFVRPLSGGLARLALGALQEALPRFDEAGYGIVAFTRGDLALARDWVPRYHLRFPLVVDEDGRWFDAYGVGRDRGLVRSVASLASRERLRNAGRALLEGRSRPDAGLDQLAAEFVIGADGRLRYARYARSVLDLPDIEGLWTACTG